MYRAHDEHDVLAVVHREVEGGHDDEHSRSRGGRRSDESRLYIGGTPFLSVDMEKPTPS